MSTPSSQNHNSPANEPDENSVEFLLGRSISNHENGNYIESLSDASAALKIEPTNVTALIRKGMACYNLEEYDTALIALERCLSLDSSNKSAGEWRNKCLAELEKLEPATVSNTANSTADVADTKKQVVSGPVGDIALPTSSQMEGRVRIKHDWLQSDSFVTVTIYQKNVQPNDVTAEYTMSSLSVTIKLGGDSEYQLHLDLCGPIIPSQCKVIARGGAKVEVKLKKESVARWSSLERSAGGVSAWDSVNDKPGEKLAYPSSKGKKNWDKIGVDEADEPTGPDGELNKLFQDIFSKGDEDTRRAMMKSYVESGGTVLSTNWKDVGSRKVEGSAPEGMEMHSWKEAQLEKK